MNIILRESNSLILDSQFFLVKRGRGFIRVIFENGQVYNCAFHSGDIVGNFFSFHKPNFLDNFQLPFHFEIVTISEFTELELLDLNYVNDNFINQFVIQLLRQNFINIVHFLLPKQLSFLLTLLDISENGIVNKECLTYENFHMSKSSFYSIYSQMKKEKILSEGKNSILLNMAKAMKKMSSCIES